MLFLFNYAPAGKLPTSGQENAGAIAEPPPRWKRCLEFKILGPLSYSLEAATLVMYCHYAPNLNRVSACLQDIRFIYSRFVWTVGGMSGSGGGFDGRFSAFAILMVSYVSLGYWRCCTLDQVRVFSRILKIVFFFAFFYGLFS